MVQVCCLQVECASKDPDRETKSCYEKLCCCIAKHMSQNKCLSVVPWAPIVAIILFSVAGGFILRGVELVIASVGVQVSRTLALASQGAVLGVVLIDLVFCYSVCSNKLRIHNAHCNAEGCRGYRIKDAEGCCSKIGRCICKVYNSVIVSLSWISYLVIMVLAVFLSFFSGCTLLVAALCDISQPAIQTIVTNIQAIPVEQSPFANFIEVLPTTNSSTVCDRSADITMGSLYMVIAGPAALFAQTILMLSFFVVWEVSWRHMKDQHREEERLAGGGAEMGESRMGGGSCYASAAGGSCVGRGPACPYDCGGGGGGAYGGGGGGGGAYGGGGGFGAGYGGGSGDCTRGSFGVASTNI